MKFKYHLCHFINLFRLLFIHLCFQPAARKKVKRRLWKGERVIQKRKWITVNGPEFNSSTFFCSVKQHGKCSLHIEAPIKWKNLEINWDRAEGLLFQGTCCLWTLTICSSVFVKRKKNQAVSPFIVHVHFQSIPHCAILPFLCLPVYLANSAILFISTQTTHIY